MESFFFGPPPDRLFGVYTPPSSPAAPECGVVLCHPMGQEYVRCHRTLSRLASALAAVGLHVLRFDYFGCGDSHGKSEQGSIRRWVADINNALDELKSGTGVSCLHLVGLRLGGSLGWLAGATRNDVHRIVMWEPIVSGKDYLSELQKRHEQWVSGSFAAPRWQRRERNCGDAPCEVLGFPISSELNRELMQLDMLKPDHAPTLKQVLVRTNQPWAGELVRSLQEAGANALLDQRSTPQVWVKMEEGLDEVSVPAHHLESIATWLAAE